MLAAYFDASAGYHSGPKGSTASTALQGLRLESHIVLNSTEVEEKLASISQVCTLLSTVLRCTLLQSELSEWSAQQLQLQELSSAGCAACLLLS